MILARGRTHEKLSVVHRENKAEQHVGMESMHSHVKPAVSHAHFFKHVRSVHDLELLFLESSCTH